MATPRRPDVEISSDGATVWVNGPDGAIGRFGARGIDVHTVDTSGCLYCTHELTGRSDWDVFAVKMREHHGVDVDDEHMPVRLNGRRMAGHAVPNTID